MLNWFLISCSSEGEAREAKVRGEGSREYGGMDSYEVREELCERFRFWFISMGEEGDGRKGKGVLGFEFEFGLGEVGDVIMNEGGIDNDGD